MSDTNEIAISTSSTLTKECPSCGKLNSARNTYCVKCRTRLSDTPSSEVRPPTGELTAPPPTPSTEIARIFSDMSSIKALLATRIGALRPRQMYFDLGIVLSQRQEYNKAAEAFRNALSAPIEDNELPRTFDIRLYLAYTLEEAGNSEQAFRNYLEAVFETVSDEAAVAHSILSHMQSLLTPDIVISQGEWVIDECLPRISNTAIPVSARKDIALLVVRLYLYLASYTQAEEILRQAMSFAPYEVPAATEELLTPDKLPPNLAIYQTDINASYVLARLYAATENTTQAALYIDNAFELQADGSGTVAKSLSPSFDAGAYQLKAQLQAKAELSKANGRREEASQSLLEAARNYYFKNELKLALALFREAKELNPYQPLVYWYLADCLRMLSLENPSLVQDSIKVWEQGYALQPMDDDNSWAYLVRGLIYELQCNLPRVNPWVVAWRAVCCAEQAMMYPSAHNSVNYAYLGRFYRNVQLEANVLKATEKAVQLEENNTFALAERAVILANVGEFEQAEKVIDAWIKLEPGTALRDGIQGYVYWHRERKDEGFDLLKKAIEQDESVLWYREIRGYFYYLQGDIDLASQDCEWIWSKYKETRQLDIENINRYAEAAYILGKYDETLELLDRFPDSPFQDANSRYGLIGMSYLALGKLGPGEDALNTCVALISNRRQISDLLDELHILLTTSESWSHKEHIPEIVERVEERVHQRNNEIEHPIAPEQELAGIVERTGLAIQVEYGPEPVNIIQRVKERVQKRLSELEQPVVLEEEPLFILEQIVQAVQSEFESAPVEEGEDSIHFMEDTTDVVDSSDKWVWIAAMAGRARIFVEQMNWLEAAKIYSTLFVRAKEHFPEARLGIETVCDRLLDEMAKCFRENQLGTYYDEIRDAVQHLLSLILDDKQRLARACTQFVYLSFPQAGEADLSVADFGDFIVNMVVAIQLYHDSSIAEPGTAVGQVWRTMLNDIPSYWQLDELCRILTEMFKLLAAEKKTDVQLQNDFNMAREALTEFLNDYFLLKEQSAETSPYVPVVNPITLELGLDLIPREAFDPNWQWSLITTYLPEMRQRLKKETGIEIPGVNVRDNLTIPNMDYVLLIDEKRVSRGNIPAGRPYSNAAILEDIPKVRYCPVPFETLDTLGIPYNEVFEAVHPLTGKPGYWIPAAYWETLITAGIELWEDPLIYVIAHLESILRKNLAAFLGIQDAKRLLDLWSKDEKNAAYITANLSDTTATFHFYRLLQTLVRESFPLTNPEVIFAALEGVDLVHDSMNDITHSVQSKLKSMSLANIQAQPSLQEENKMGGN